MICKKMRMNKYNDIATFDYNFFYDDDDDNNDDDDDDDDGGDSKHEIITMKSYESNPQYHGVGNEDGSVTMIIMITIKKLKI